MTLVDIRNSLVLLIIALNFVLNAGFMLVRVPPGVGSDVLWETRTVEDWQLRCP